MKRRKKMFISGGVILAVIAISITSFIVFDKNNRQIEISEADTRGNPSIFYGGSHDEFADTGQEDDENTLNSGEKDNEINETEIKSPKEIIEESKNMYEGDIYNTDDADPSGAYLQVAKTNETDNTGNDESADDEENVIQLKDSDGYEEHEVICDAASEEEAEDIALRISGNVISCNNGVAVIQITESVDALLERLEQQGSDLKLYRKYYFSTKQ